jgi:DNA invertase Pin-like site-specific DNA recombinase
MAGQRVGYVRVSTADQNTDRQLDGIELDRVFTDHISGATRNRPQLTDLRRYVRDGDTVVVHSMDRLARNLDDLRALVREFTDAGVAVEFVREHMTFTGKDSPMQQLMLSLLGAVAEFERALIRERQREGIELAKKRGVYKGRRPSLTAAQVAELRAQAAAGVPKTQLAKQYEIHRDTVYRYLADSPDAPVPWDPPDALGTAERSHP